MIGGTRRFEPSMMPDVRQARLAAWNKALAAV
jgi:hypothetical protein